MTNKEKIQRMLEKLPDDVSYDRMIYHLEVMRQLEESIEQAERGEVIDHDQLFEELLAEDAQESSNRLDKTSPKTARSAANGRGVRSKATKQRQKT
jgi:hypothetical protein